MRRSNYASAAKLQQQRIDDWNGRYPEGTKVRVTLDDGRQMSTTTRSAAWLLGGHTAVVMVEGISGCYLLQRVRAEAELHAGAAS